jgi:hypothetical protein
LKRLDTGFRRGDDLPRFRRNSKVSVLNWVDKTNAKLAALDPAAWTAEEITAFAASLGELKKTILALLKTEPATPAKR